MNQPVFLNHIDWVTLPNQGNKIPRERYQQYVEDLYRIYPGKASPESYVEGGQYTYVELGQALFDAKFESPTLKNLDTLIVAHWSQEFDPDYAACGPYFLHHYQLNADVFDVCDQGSLAPFTALKILMQYQYAGKSETGMVLCLEQTTVPRDKNAGDLIPSENGALALSVSVQHQGFQILAVDLLTEFQVLEAFQKLDQLILERLANVAFKLEETLVLIRKGTAVFRVFKHQMLRSQSRFVEDQLQFIPPQLGCLTAFKKLAEQQWTRRFILLIEEDSESLGIAFALLENQT